MRQTLTPVSICWHCDQTTDAVSDVVGKRTPEAGDVTLCLYCCAVAILEHDLTLRRPTVAELHELEDHHEFRQAFTAFAWARQFVMRERSLTRDRKHPDR